MVFCKSAILESDNAIFRGTVIYQSAGMKLDDAIQEALDYCIP